MLSITTDPKAPYAATILSDLRQVETPHAVCVAKCRFVFCAKTQEWVWHNTAPDFQEIDCWDTVPTRQVTDLVPEKKQAELLLWGKVQSGARVLMQENANTKTIVKVGNLSPEPVLYWQSEWQPRPKGDLSKMHFMAAPKYARVEKSWEQINALRFQGIFSTPAIAADTVFQISCFEVLGVLISESVQSTVPFSCDSICVNTDEGHIDMVWRARLPWDLMGERVGVLSLDIRRKKEDFYGRVRGTGKNS